MVSTSGIFTPDSRNVGGRGMVFDHWSNHRNAMRAQPTSQKKYGPKMSVLSEQYDHSAASRISYNRAMKRGLSLDPLKFQETKNFEQRIEQISKGVFDRKGIDNSRPKTSNLARAQSAQRRKGRDPIWEAHVKQLSNMQRRIREYDTPFERKKNIQYGPEFNPAKLMRSSAIPLNVALSKKTLRNLTMNDDRKASSFLVKSMDKATSKRFILADKIIHESREKFEAQQRDNSENMSIIRPSTALEITRGGNELSQMASNYIQNFMRPSTAPMAGNMKSGMGMGTGTGMGNNRAASAAPMARKPPARKPTHIMVFRVGQDYLMDTGDNLTSMSDAGSVAGEESYLHGSHGGASHEHSYTGFTEQSSTASPGKSSRGTQSPSTKYINTSEGKRTLEPIRPCPDQSTIGNMAAEIELDASVERAATSIQAAFRGHTVRRNLEKSS